MSDLTKTNPRIQKNSKNYDLPSACRVHQRRQPLESSAPRRWFPRPGEVWRQRRRMASPTRKNRGENVGFRRRREPGPTRGSPSRSEPRSEPETLETLAPSAKLRRPSPCAAARTPPPPPARTWGWRRRRRRGHVARGDWIGDGWLAIVGEDRGWGGAKRLAGLLLSASCLCVDYFNF